MDYYIVKWSEEGKPYFMRNQATGEPLVFRESIVPEAIAKGLRATGTRAECLAVDPDFEDVILPVEP